MNDNIYRAKARPTAMKGMQEWVSLEDDLTAKNTAMIAAHSSVGITV